MININHFLWAYLLIYGISSLSEIAVNVINEIHLKKEREDFPDGFEGLIDRDKLSEMNAYTIDRTRSTIASTVAGKALFLFIILSGLLPWLSDILSGYYFILSGLIFLAVPGLLGSLVDLPFRYYDTFGIEARYGFNTYTIGTWVLDLLKSFAIALVLGGVLLSLLLIMVQYTGKTWWIWAWLIFSCFEILVTVLYPTVIAPLFNTFVPVQNEDLAIKIRELSEREGLVVKGIFQMDAGRRSRHTNAYFSGLGRSKRIVLYDTLLDAHTDDEILAVLAHEIGHLKQGHIRKQLIIMGGASLILFFLASKMMTWQILYASFGFSVAPVYVGLFLIAAVWEPLGFFLSPLAMLVSRRFEREADRYTGSALKRGKDLISALKKMALDNLSNLRPHPLYVIFHYSHPPLLERIENLKKMI